MAGLRLGLVRNNFLDEADGRIIMPEGDVRANEIALIGAADTMREAGAEVLNVNMDLDFEGIKALIAAEQAIWLSDFKEDLGACLAELKESPVRTIKELIEWNIKHAVSDPSSRASIQDQYIPRLTVRPKSYRLMHQPRVPDRRLGRRW